MATPTMNSDVSPSSSSPRFTPLAGEIPRLSWGAIFGGTFTALGVWALLYSLGLALGLSSINPANPSSARAAGIGAGIWSLIAPLIALFIGGMIASRTAGLVDRGAGAIHGAVLWGLTTVVGVVVLSYVLGSVVGGIVGAGTHLATAAAPAVTSAAPSDPNTLMNEASKGLQQGKQQLSQLGAQAQSTALKAADGSGKAMWGVFASLLLGLISSVLGAAFGVTRRQRAAAVERVVVPSKGTSGTGGREVYP